MQAELIFTCLHKTLRENYFHHISLSPSPTRVLTMHLHLLGSKWKKIAIYFHALLDFMPLWNISVSHPWISAFRQLTSVAAPDNALAIDYKSPIAISEAHKKPISANFARRRKPSGPECAEPPNLGGDGGGTSSAYIISRAPWEPPSFITWQQYMPTRDWPDKAWDVELFLARTQPTW